MWLLCRMITRSHQFSNHCNHGHFKIANLTKEKDRQSNSAKICQKRPQKIAIYPLLQDSNAFSLKLVKLRLKAILTMSGPFLVKEAQSYLKVVILLMMFLS